MPYFTDQMLPRIQGPDKDGCLLWTGARKNGGYGYVQRQRSKAIRIHRIVYEEFVEPLDNRILHHTCGNKACVNPDHLEPVEDQTEHWQYHASKLCPQGHNDWRRTPSTGRRYCRICAMERSRRYYQRTKG